MMMAATRGGEVVVGAGGELPGRLERQADRPIGGLPRLLRGASGRGASG